MATRYRRNGTQGKQDGVEALVRGWETSGLTQREYCERHGVPLSTFGYYRRRQMQGEREGASSASWPSPMLLPLTIKATNTEQNRSSWDFVLTLRNGRRVESGWGFVDSELARLLRVAEQE